MTAGWAAGAWQLLHASTGFANRDHQLRQLLLLCILSAFVVDVVRFPLVGLSVTEAWTLHWLAYIASRLVMCPLQHQQRPVQLQQAIFLPCRFLWRCSTSPCRWHAARAWPFVHWHLIVACSGFAVANELQSLQPVNPCHRNTRTRS
jgi:hypothetical protein